MMTIGNGTARATELGDLLLAHGLRLATAESCTGGLIAKYITDVAGSSQWFDRGFVCYSNAAKQQMLGVSAATLAGHGAVSEAVARELAAGAKRQAGVELAVAVTGIAGPDGGGPDKPVGTVWFGFAWPDGSVEAQCRHFQGDREGVRKATAEHAIETLIGTLKRRMES